MPYTTVQRVKEAAGSPSGADLGFPSDAALDAFITNNLIPAADRWIDDYCNTSFGATASQTDLFDGDELQGRKAIQLRKRPVVSITSLDFKKDDGTWDTKPSSDYYLKGERTLVYKSSFPAGFQNIRVVYTWGYASVPASVQEASTRICTNALQRIKALRLGSRVAFGELSSQQLVPDAIDSYVKALLASYREESIITS